MIANFIDTVASDLGFMPMERAREWNAVERRLDALDFPQLDVVDRYKLTEYIITREDCKQWSAGTQLQMQDIWGTGEWTSIEDDLAQLGVASKLDPFERCHLALDVILNRFGHGSSAR
ncbi:hypothetical protein FY136_28510 (plasmid) [Agrobacterium tumefaciens]|uniref:hypothetical protein n=1 Tax=Agrobacterium tumefaciens TaxID=358 RepID=UPI0021D0D5AA|nr:hypothetical protein [Agrobacterium tumefaciens]UXT53206.1 hypothetical protein FY136_28510 [Agrobacterium tumefaciens]